MTRTQVQIVAFESTTAFALTVEHDPSLVLGRTLPLNAVSQPKPEVIAVLLDAQAYTGATLELFLKWCESADSVHVRTLVVGCVCCVGGSALRTEVIRTLRLLSPTQLVIVASHDARLEELADAILQPTLAPHLELRQIAYVQNVGSNKKLPGSVSGFLTGLDSGKAVWSDRPLRVSGDYAGIGVWPNSIVFSRTKLLDCTKQPTVVLQMSLLLKELNLQSICLVARTERAWYQFEWSLSLEGDQALEIQVELSNWRKNSIALLLFDQPERALGGSRNSNEISELIATLNTCRHS